MLELAEARALLHGQLQMLPNHPLILERLSDIDALATHGAAGSVSGPYPMPPHRPDPAQVVALVALTRAALKGGATMLQLRAKGRSTRELLAFARAQPDNVVLLIDTERPLPWLPRLLNKLVLRVVRWTAYVKDARKNLYDWEERFETAVRTADGFALAPDEATETPPVDTGAKSVPNRK